jgi:hypothetical protein
MAAAAHDRIRPTSDRAGPLRGTIGFDGKRSRDPAESA